MEIENSFWYFFPQNIKIQILKKKIPKWTDYYFLRSILTRFQFEKKLSVVENGTNTNFNGFD